MNMKGKFVLTTVLCLAVAALGIGAAPALAADGCTCHTDASPTATPAHTPFVVDVTDCTTCHVGWTVPHPVAVDPTLDLHATTGGVEELVPVPQFMLWGRLGAGGGYLNGVLVSMQQRLAGAGEYVAVHQMATLGVFPFGPGHFWGALASAEKGTRYRAVSQGDPGPPVVKPGLSEETVLTPQLRQETRGLNAGGNLRLGRSLRYLGKAAPSWVAGETVRIALRKYSHRPRDNRVVQRFTRVLRADDPVCVFRCLVKPRSSGRYLITAILPATAEHPRVSADAFYFRVFKPQ
jgi:hypothetical protein